MSSDFLLIIVVLAAGGLVMGFLAGLFGIGGGGIVVPILYELFRLQGVPEDIRMHVSIGTSLAIMVPTTIRSAHAHARRGSLEVAVVKRFAGPILIGVVFGTLVANAAPAIFFKVIWVCFASAMSAKLLVAKEDWGLGTDLPQSKLVELYGTFVGCISTLLSIGGGIFISMLLNLYGRPLKTAVGTAAGVGPLIAIPGAVGFMWAGWGGSGTPYLSLGYVSPIAALLAIPTSVAAAPLGVKLAHGIPRRHLELAMAAFYSLVAFRFAVALIR